MKRLFKAGFLALGTAFLINLLPWYGYARTGDDSSLLPIVSVVMVVIIAVLAGCFSLLEGITDRASWGLRDETIRDGLRKFVHAWGIALGLCVGMSLGIFTVHRIRTVIYTRAIDAAEPVLRALLKYEEEHGHGPVSLKHLVPDYLVTIPACGFVGKHFSYHRGPAFFAEEDEEGEEGWQLAVGFGGIWFPYLLHFNSAGLYPERTTRIRDWGLTLYP